LFPEVPQRGISRHVVRFVSCDGKVYALKEIAEPLARREYALLVEFEDDGLPTTSVLRLCVDRPDGQQAILVMPFENLIVDAAGDQVLTVFTPQPGSPEHDAIRLLASWERSLLEPCGGREFLGHLSCTRQTP
jgi:hypothetical protein